MSLVYSYQCDNCGQVSKRWMREVSGKHYCTRMECSKEAIRLRRLVPASQVPGKLSLYGSKIPKNDPNGLGSLARAQQVQQADADKAPTTRRDSIK